MNKIIAEIKDLALNGDSTANAIFKEIAGLSDKELALYLGDDANADKVAKLLGVQYLVKKDANQELAKDFYELRNRGRQMMNPDRGQMLDVYNEKLKDVPYYMEKFGLPTEQGKYKVEDQIQFVKNINKLDPVELQNLANQEGFANADQMRNEIKRTGERLMGDIARKGLNPETGGTTLKSVLRSAASLAAPRIVEAQELGQDPSWKDVVGDEIELGLNFVPGMSAVSKGARALSKFNRLKNLPNSALARIAGGATEMSVAPLGSQAYDYAVYDNDDPRGQWDWERVGAQYAGGLAGLGTIKGIGAQGKNLLEGTAGKADATNPAKSLMNVIENIGNDAKENIARRQLVMERKADMAADRGYRSNVYLTSKQNETGYVANADDIINKYDFNIRKNEAERLGNSQPNRVRLEQIKNEMRNNDLSNIAEYRNLDASLKNYNGLNNVVQIDDGRFVPKALAESDNFYDNSGRWNVQGLKTSAPKEFTILKNYPDPASEGSREIARGDMVQSVNYAPRDKVVRRELANDPDFDVVASGRADRQPFYNTAAYAGFNAVAREGTLSDNIGIGMDEKRETALWNNQLKQLRPLVQIDGASSEYKRQMVDAIMNVMTYGEDLPEDMYKQNRNAYDAIAQRLGISYNNSFKEVADYPTTSYSSAR